MATGGEAAQFRRLDHVVEKHGVRVIECPGCPGTGCAECDGTGAAFLAKPGWSAPCGPTCPLHEARPV